MSEGGIPWTEGTARTRSQCGVHLAEEQQGGQSGWSGEGESNRPGTQRSEGGGSLGFHSGAVRRLWRILCGKGQDGTWVLGDPFLVAVFRADGRGMRAKGGGNISGKTIQRFSVCRS